MTIEEKREAVTEYCRERTDCENCPLLGTEHHWRTPCVSRFCPNIADSSEEDLDKALVIIAEAAEKALNNIQVATDAIHDFLNKKLILPDDPVNHPSHYTDGKIEVIDFITDKKLGFCLGNAVKYIARAGKKDPSKTVEDLEKAIWYIKHHIETLKEG